MDHLPALIHITPEIRTQFHWLDNIIKLIIAETEQDEPGSEVLVDKYTEVLFIQILRAYSKQENHQLSYFSALLDKHISQALKLIHSSPEKDWTVELLAAEVGLSRSSFYTKFNHLVGASPMKYVFKWRMMQARDKLENTPKSMITIAEEVGYQSENAFQKAFKRFYQLTPSALRKKR
jgi:AraC-like DNA-binding protein